MKVGIHKNYRGEVSLATKKYIKILEINLIEYEILDINQIDFWDRIKTCTHFIFHWGGYTDHYQIAHTILPIIENDLNIKCFPNLRTYWHYDDKIRQYYLLKNLGYPIIDSWIFWDKREALSWLQSKAVFPLVFKLKSGAASKDVVFVQNLKHCIKILNKIFSNGIRQGNIPGNFSIKIKDFQLSIFIDRTLKIIYRILQRRDIKYNWGIEKNYVLFQRFLPNNDYDTRVTVIGDRAFAFRRFNRKNDFRSSGSGKIDYDINKIDMNFIKLAFSISKGMNFQSMAYDFLYDGHKPAFCEISYTYVDKAIYNCSGYWDTELNWHEGHYWPQYFHMMDFLEESDLKQPLFSD